MRVVNIVPEDVVDNAKAKMFAAADWSLQRWYEEGRESDSNNDEGEGDNDMDSDVERERANRAADNTYEEEEEEEEDVSDFAADEQERLEEEHEEEAYDHVHHPLDVPIHVLGDSDEEREEAEDVPHGRSPVGHVEDLGEDTLSHGRSPVGSGKGPEGEEVVHPEADRSPPVPVASFTSGVPPTPGRGFRHDDVPRTSEEQVEYEYAEPPAVLHESAQEVPQDVCQEGMPSTWFTRRPTSRNKKKASRKGMKSQGIGSGGDTSASLEGSGPTPEEGNVNVCDVPPIDTQSQSAEALPAGLRRADLNVTSPVEEVAAAVLEVTGQGRPNADPTGDMAGEVHVAASASEEAEVVIRAEVICLDSDDDVPERCVQLDVRVKVKDRAPYRVRGTFADYMTDDSEDEGYGEPGYSRVKLNFVDDPHPVFAGRAAPIAADNDSDKGRQSDEKDKVHFAPFVDKYLSEVPENVRLNLAHMYKSYDYHKVFAYLSTPAFCEAVKVKHILHAASLKKMRKRWTAFEAPRERNGRGQYPGSTAAQAQSVVDSTLEIIDISGVQDSPRREVHVGAAGSSSPPGFLPSSPVRPAQEANPPSPPGEFTVLYVF